MSTGPEHYREAERLLLECRGGDVDLYPVPQLLAEAQIHAILALAAATGNDPGCGSGLGRSDNDANAWLAIADPELAAEAGAES